jgi:hypothetical protein
VLITNQEIIMAQVERIADKAVAQTRGAADGYFDLMQKAFSMYPVGGTELAEKMQSYTKQNPLRRTGIHKEAKPSQEFPRYHSDPD